MRLFLPRLIGLCLIISVIGMVLELGAWTHDFPLDPSAIKAGKGHHFKSVLESSFGIITVQGPGNLRKDTSRLFENGIEIGQPTQGYWSIEALGEGRFTTRHNRFHFSTSDNTDPRINGRDYVVRAQYRFEPYIWHIALIVLVGAYIRARLPNQPRQLMLRGGLTSRALWNLDNVLQRIPDSAIIILLLIPLMALIAIRAWSTAWFFNGFPTDGPLQLYNALTRMNAGQVPGKDFFAFHGIGFLWMFILPFKWLGANLFASEILRQSLPALVSGAILIGGLGFFLRSWVIAILIAVLLIAQFDYPYIPGNSLNSIRSAWPVLAILVFGWLVRRDAMTAQKRALLAGALMGFGIFWAYEQGVYLTMAAMATGTLAMLANPRSLTRHLRNAGWMTVGFAATIVVAFSIGTWGAGREVLTYAFGDIPNTQMWYFGVAPNSYLHRFSQLWEENILRTAIVHAVLLIVCGSVFAVYRLRGRLADAPTMAGLTLCFYALASNLSYLGILSGNYVTPSLRVLHIIMPFAIWLILRDTLHLLGIGTTRIRSLTRNCAIVVTLMLFILIKNETATAAMTAARTQCPPVSELGVRLSKSYEKLFDFHDYLAKRLTGPHDLFSTYEGPLNKMTGTNNPGRADYIIHALGPEARAGYIRDFIRTNPTFVTTVKRSLFDYTDWLRYSHWDFYSHIFANYRPVMHGHALTLWERVRPAATTMRYRSCVSIDENIPFFAPIDGPANRLYEIRVRYMARQLPIRLPIIGRMPRFVIEPHGTLAFKIKSPFIQGTPIRPADMEISLPPEENEWRFPVLAEAGAKLSFNSRVKSILPGATLDIRSLTICEPDLPTETVIAIME
ncbi:MAG: hypothetical protein U9N14_00610 [Pseudomonadota bacterium]|nr:hypothetical protein [Pseudomonadota bacterium]